MAFIDIEEQKEKLVSFLSDSDFDQYVSVFLIKIKKSQIELYKQESDKKTKQVLVNSCLNSMSQSTFLNREIKMYDPVTTYKNVHEQVEVSSYENIQEKITKFNKEEEYLTSTDTENEKSLHNYMITISKDSVINQKFIGSFVNVFQLKKKMVLGNFTDSRIEIREKNDLVGFGKKIDLLIIDDMSIIINQAEAKFESIFGMNEKFSEQATNILNSNRYIDEIFSADSIAVLKEKVKTGKRIATRLIKIVSDETRFKKTVDHIYKIEEILNDKNHPFYPKVKNVHYNNGKLSIDDDKHSDQLVNAISDAFVKAFISEVETVEEGRM